MKLKSVSVLVLNATYQPLSIVPATRAISLIVSGKASALDGTGTYFNSATDAIEIPYVVLLNRAVKQRSNPKRAKFSRRGVMIRDNSTCAYCGKHAETIDHVVPRALGGISTYENCVAACLTCNRKKADRTLAQVGWIVSYTLKAPSPLTTMLDKANRAGGEFDAWKPYILMFDPSLAHRRAPVNH